MRWIAITLLGFNLLLAAWYLFVPRDQIGAVVSSSAPALAHNNIKLAESIASTNLAVPRGGASSPEQQCAFIGRFAARQDAVGVRDRLAGLEITTTVVEAAVPDAPLWWVYIPPFSTTAEAERGLRVLAQANVESFLVSEGEFRNAISLGYFRSRDNAQGLRDRLAAEGQNAMLREIQRTTATWWIQAAPEQAGLVSENTVRTVAASLPDIVLRQADCGWLQNS
ncbi:SPOR domain-containing protein [Salinispirillum sp. LH 10-3-1]|uniref:SPOR domain-containing protein n=1 Tax=Salinispirillum sp. LH 10-3-1 TaxID=2952525 RepID=A0AB38YEI0_9GAMM